MRCSRGKNRIGKTFDGVNGRSRTNKTSPAGGARLAHQEGKWRYSRSSPCHSGADPSSACKPAPRSGCASLRRLPGLSRPGADWLARSCRPDAERPPRGDRGDRGLGLGSEERAATGAELGFVPDHAGRDAVDIRNFGTAQAKRIAAARLLLVGGVGPACRWPHRNRERGCEHQAELEIPGPDSKHESPRTQCWPLRIVGEWRGIRKADRTPGLNLSGTVFASLEHISDLSQTSRQFRKVPTADISHLIRSPHRRASAALYSR